ncbi:MAG: D-2-hydroxyacid dehydrogenase [Gammaproteobacteria bacterium]|nr:D-2-hydroxyacid dehydrogenase [Gammaproteobacteria bacterium]
MKAVFLDFATMGGGGLDPSPLQQRLPGLKVFENTQAERTVERIREAEFVLANKVKLNANNLADATALRFIGLTATGTDNIDLEFAKENGIAVCNIRAYCTQSIVEHVMGTLLSLTHSLRPFNDAVRQGAWQKAQEFCMLDFPIRELSAMTLGIVGNGVLGQGVARAAEFFGMNVMIARRRGDAGTTDDGRVDFEEMLQQADVISLHCPLNDATHELMGADEFRAMKADSILINTARGGLVDSTALAAALGSGEIAAAAIDVLPQEPPVDGDPLLDYTGNNLIVTPHIAWGTFEARQNAINELAENVAAFQRGEQRNRVV